MSVEKVEMTQTVNRSSIYLGALDSGPLGLPGSGTGAIFQAVGRRLLKGSCDLAYNKLSPNPPGTYFIGP